MHDRRDRHSQTRRTADARRRQLRRRQWSRSLFLMLLALLVLAACVAPIGQAHPAGEGSSGEARATSSDRVALKQERAASRQALKEAEREAREKRREERIDARRNNAKRDRAAVSFNCSELTVNYVGFPNLAHNTVSELVTVDKVRSPITQFSFDGPTGSHSIPVVAPPGKYHIDLYAKWTTNGTKGGFDHLGEVSCSGVAFAIEKLQRIAGSGGPYTTAPLTAQEGQKVEYEIIVKNTGYLPLSFSGFTDSHCGTGTISGGPNGEPLAVGATATYTCAHTLSAADQLAGSYTNTATDTASALEGEGTSVTHTSNTVVVTVTAALPEEKITPPEEKTSPTEENKASSGGQTNTPASGTLASSGSSPLTSPLTLAGKSGVLAFTASTAPSLRGPQGCMRGRFTARLRSTGVGSVTFYLDGHKFKTLTSRNAHKGQLAITIDAAKLKVGAHRLLAKITMAASASAAKATRASRTLTFVRCRSAAVDPKFTG